MSSVAVVTRALLSESEASPLPIIPVITATPVGMPWRSAARPWPLVALAVAIIVAVALVSCAPVRIVVARILGVFVADAVAPGVVAGNPVVVLVITPPLLSSWSSIRTVRRARSVPRSVGARPRVRGRLGGRRQGFSEFAVNARSNDGRSCCSCLLVIRVEYLPFGYGARTHDLSDRSAAPPGLPGDFGARNVLAKVSP